MEGNCENWRNSFWWSTIRESFLGKMTFKRSSDFQKFSRENVEIFLICQEVLESEKVENRWARGKSGLSFHTVLSMSALY